MTIRERCALASTEGEKDCLKSALHLCPLTYQKACGSGTVVPYKQVSTPLCLLQTLGKATITRPSEGV